MRTFSMMVMVGLSLIGMPHAPLAAQLGGTLDWDSPCKRDADCLDEITLDLDLDDVADTVRLLHVKELDPPLPGRYSGGRYFVSVRYGNGRMARPFYGAYDPQSDVLTLEVRQGPGGVICFEWSADLGCGYYDKNDPIGVFALKHSRAGVFLFIPTRSVTCRRRHYLFLCPPGKDGEIDIIAMRHLLPFPASAP